jgi:hypothetical protein
VQGKLSLSLDDLPTFVMSLIAHWWSNYPSIGRLRSLGILHLTRVRQCVGEELLSCIQGKLRIHVSPVTSLK